MDKKHVGYKFFSFALILPFLMVGMLCCCPAAQASTISSNETVLAQSSSHSCCQGQQSKSNPVKPADQTKCQKDIYTLERDIITSGVLEKEAVQLQPAVLTSLISDDLFNIFIFFKQKSAEFRLAKFTPFYIQYQQFRL